MQSQEGLLITRAEAGALLAAHDGDVALLFLYLRGGGAPDLEAAARELCRTRAEMEAASEKLRRMGLEEKAAPPVQKPLPAEELPEYRAEDITRRSKEDSTFSAIVKEAQRKLGRALSTSDLKKLFGIYDYLALPGEVIMLLLNYCVGSTAGGNPPTMRQIEKEAYTWANREILTIEQAEEYIASSKRRKDRLYQLGRLLGLGGRALSPTESKYLNAWLDMGFGDELIELAYDRTLTNTGSLKWNYMNSILKSWHEQGLLTPGDVRDKDIMRRGRAKPKLPPKPRDLGKLLADLDKI